MLKNEKARRASAKSKFELLGTYNLVRALAWASGRTVDEEVRSTRPKALRVKYERAVASGGMERRRRNTRDKRKSLHE